MIAALLILILKISPLILARPNCTRLNKNRLDTDNNGSGDIKNLLIVINLAKSKKMDFTKVKPFRTNFLTSRAKKNFIHLQKIFIKTSIFRHIDPKCHI